MRCPCFLVKCLELRRDRLMQYFAVQLDLDPEEDESGSGLKAYVDAFLEQTGGFA